MSRFTMTIPSCSKYFSSVRLFISGLLSVENLDIDTIEDYKMAVTEGLNILKLDGEEERIELEFQVEKNSITTTIEKFEVERDEQNEMAFMVLECLVDKVEVKEKKLLIAKNYNEKK